MKNLNLEFYPENSNESKKYLKLIGYLITSAFFKNDQIFYVSILNGFNFKFLKNGNDFKFFDIGTKIDKNNVILIINPNIFFKKNETEMLFRLIHETEHILNEHVCFNIKDEKKFNQLVSINRKYKNNDGEYEYYTEYIPLANIAMDLEVNSLKYGIVPTKDFLKPENNINFFESTDYLLTEGIFPYQKEFLNIPPHKDWQWYYNKIIDNAKNNKDGFTMDESYLSMPDSLSNEIFGDWEYIEGNTDFKTNLNNIITSGAKMAGNNTPDRYKSFLNDFTNIKFNWKNALSTYIKKGIVSKKRNSKRKQNRRGIAKGAILQGYVNEFDINVIAAIDTSGSISQSQFEDAVDHLNKIRQSTKAKVYVMCVDTEVHFLEELTEYNYKNIIKTGVGSSFSRGGTSFFPIFNTIKEKKIKADILIIFTDGYNSEGLFSNPLPNMPTLWVYTKQHKKHNFGNYIIMEN